MIGVTFIEVEARYGRAGSARDWNRQQWEKPMHDEPHDGRDDAVTWPGGVVLRDAAGRLCRLRAGNDNGRVPAPVGRPALALSRVW